MFPCRRHLKANGVGNGLHVLRKSGGTGATAERIQEIMEPQVERPVAAQIYTYPQPHD
jgi:hypothetical protein